MAKKSNNNALYALAGIAGVGALAFALWPREQDPYARPPGGWNTAVARRRKRRVARF